MFVGITNTPRDYAWGSTTAIARLLGTTPSGHPEAELWLGAHPGSPSRIEEPVTVGGARTLAEWSESAELPFLLKLLAAEHPLSLQAHPNREQAIAGFARENALGVPLDAPHRNYRDPHAKPELIVALSETFDALCGFRPVHSSRSTLALLGDAADGILNLLRDDSDLPAVVDWLLADGEAAAELVAAVERLAPHIDSTEFHTAVRLASEHPGDPGIVISLLLNHVRLRRGEALYLPAGNIHAYLGGLGLELMGSSDNVLRGGLTQKHVDRDELRAVLDFTPITEVLLPPVRRSEAVSLFAPEGSPLRLALVHPRSGTADVSFSGAAIAVCTAGDGQLSGALSSRELRRGDFVFITADETSVRVTGDAEVFIAFVAEHAVSGSSANVAE